MNTVCPTNWTHAANIIPTHLHAARWAVTALFFVNGALIATWCSRIPAIQSAHHLDNGGLGLTLLCMALGAAITMPLAGAVINRLGSDRVSKLAALAYCGMLTVVSLAPNPVCLAVALFLFGAFHGSLDVAMNAQAVAIEKRYGRPIMASFHALFSAGGLAGAAGGGLLASLGLKPSLHFSLVTALFACAILVIMQYLLNVCEEKTLLEGNPTSTPLLVWPTPQVLALGSVAFCVMMGEGAMADWSAVYLRNVLLTDESVAAMGYAAFSIAMAAGRLVGDWLTACLGRVKLLRLGGALAAAGLLMALVSRETTVALAGFTCVGLGFATIIPMVFSAAGNTPGMAPGAALASVTTMGYLGFLIAPPTIGFVAELFGLPMGLSLLVVTSITASLLARTVGPSRFSSRPAFAPTPSPAIQSVQ